MNQRSNVRKAFTLACALTTSAAAVVLGANLNNDPPPPDPCTIPENLQKLYEYRPVQVPTPVVGSVQIYARVHKPDNQQQSYEWKTQPYVPYSAGPLAPSDQPLSVSQAWWPWPLNTSGSLAVRTTGVRANLSAYAAPSPGDFLSPGATIGESSVALVPPGAGGMSTWWQGATRPTLEGCVDLVTGVPLAEFTDLRLPFDGAEFRLKRTRSSESSLGAHTAYAWINKDALADHWWDWAGAGWMSSENPILLIDASLPDVTGDGPKTTYLWLDAHHSIPFQQVFHPDPGNANGGRIEYEAPPRFRARLKHNGIPRFPSTSDTDWQSKINPDNQIGWRKPPTQFEIWLYDGAIKYTFVALYDVRPRSDGSQRYDAIGALPPIRFNKNYLQNPEGPADWAWFD